MQCPPDEDDDIKNPDENSEPNIIGKEEGGEKDQTKEEELEDPVKQDMPQKAGWLRRNGEDGGTKKILPKKCLARTLLFSVRQSGQTSLCGASSQYLAQGYPTPGGHKLA